MERFEIILPKKDLNTKKLLYLYEDPALNIFSPDCRPFSEQDCKCPHYGIYFDPEKKHVFLHNRNEKNEMHRTYLDITPATETYGSVYRENGTFLGRNTEEEMHYFNQETMKNLMVKLDRAIMLDRQTIRYYARYQPNKQFTFDIRYDLENKRVLVGYNGSFIDINPESGSYGYIYEKGILTRRNTPEQMQDFHTTYAIPSDFPEKLLTFVAAEEKTVTML